MRACFLFLLAASASCFQLGFHPRFKTYTANVQVTMGLFDALGKAFENDETLGKRDNAGLSK